MGQRKLRGMVFALALSAALFPQVALANSGATADAGIEPQGAAQAVAVENGAGSSQPASAAPKADAKATMLTSQADASEQDDKTATGNEGATSTSGAGTGNAAESASTAGGSKTVSTASSTNETNATGDSATTGANTTTGDSAKSDSGASNETATNDSAASNADATASDTTSDGKTTDSAKDTGNTSNATGSDAKGTSGTEQAGSSTDAGKNDDSAAKDTTDAKDTTAGEAADGKDASGENGSADGKADEKTDGKTDDKSAEPVSKKKYDTPVKNGVYEIYLGKEKKNPVEVADGSRKKNANVQLGEWDNEFFQKWSVISDEIGYYTFTNANSGLRLAVKGSKTKSGTTVVQVKASKAKAQKWIIVKKDDGFNIVSALSSKLFLNVKGGKAAAGKNVRVTKSGSKAQLFNFKKRTLLPVGTYVFRNKKDSKLALASPTAKRKQNVQMRLKKYDLTSQADKFYVRNEGSGLFSIQSVRSGLYLAQKDGKVVQRKDSTSKAQRWKVIYDGGIVFENAKTGKIIALAGDNAKANAKVKVAAEVTSSTQRWRPVEANLIETGIYSFQNRLGKYLTVKGGSFKKNAKVSQAAKKKNGSQVFQVDVNGKYYRFMNMRSYRAVAVKNSSKKAGASIVQRDANINHSAQLWKVSLDRDGYFVFKNKRSGKVLTVKGNSKKSGANVVQAKSNGKSGQEWRFVKAKKYSFTGDTYLDQALSTLVGSHPSLPSLFGYLKSWPYREGQRYYSNPHYLSNKVTASLAADMWRHGSGNCYRYACLFSWAARALGYKTNVVSGWVPSVSGGQAPHGWVEVYMNGHTYICDPDLAHDYGGWGFYMTTYWSAPTSYGSW